MAKTKEEAKENIAFDNDAMQNVTDIVIFNDSNNIPGNAVVAASTTIPPHIVPNPVINGVHNLIVNMNSGTGLSTLNNGLSNLAAAGQNFATAGAGAISAVSNAPSLFGQTTTAYVISNYAYYVAQHGWWIKSVINTNSSTIAQVTIGGIDVITSVVALHPQLVFLASLGVILYLNQDPLYNVAVGTKDLVVGTTSGLANATIGAAKSVAAPAFIINDLLKNIISSQHAVKSDGEHKVIDFSEIKLLTSAELKQKISNIVDEFKLINNEEPTEIVEETVSVPVENTAPSLEVEKSVEDIREGWIAITTEETLAADDKAFQPLPENETDQPEYNNQGEPINKDEYGFIVVDKVDQVDQDNVIQSVATVEDIFNFFEDLGSNIYVSGDVTNLLDS